MYCIDYYAITFNFFSEKKASQERDDVKNDSIAAERKTTHQPPTNQNKIPADFLNSKISLGMNSIKIHTCHFAHHEIFV